MWAICGSVGAAAFAFCGVSFTSLDSWAKTGAAISTAARTRERLTGTSLIRVAVFQTRSESRERKRSRPGGSLACIRPLRAGRGASTVRRVPEPNAHEEDRSHHQVI